MRWCKHGSPLPWQGRGGEEGCVKATRAAAQAIEPLTSILSPLGGERREVHRRDLDFDRLTNDIISSEALQRNVKHKAMLSNISEFAGGLNDKLRFFASLRMTD